MPLSKFIFLRPIYMGLLALFLTACEGEIDRSANPYGDEPSPISNDVDNNDDFFHAFRLNVQSVGSITPHSDSLSETDLVDYFVISISDKIYRAYHFELKTLTGDADIELFNAYSNKESWSENSDTEDEKIDYWRGYRDDRSSYVFLKVINRSGGSMTYDLEVY